MLVASQDIHDRIIGLLNEGRANYRVVDHEPEGRTDLASCIRGNPLSCAAKAMVLSARRSDGSRRFGLAVVPGDRRVSFDAMARVLGGSKAGLASADEAMSLTVCTMGAVPPFSFDERLMLVVDARLAHEPEIVFNCGRLDRSLFLSTEDYLRVAKPRIANIAT